MKPYEAIFRSALVRTDAEQVHGWAAAGIRAAGAWRPIPALGQRVLGPGAPELAVRALGLRFPSPLGVAAGFDKDGKLVDGLAALGFGSVEVGTVTASPQPGNPRPRLARLPADRAIVNRMGFNNDGSATVAARLAMRARRRDAAGQHGGVVLGINIGKTKTVATADAASDYAESTRRLAPFADYLVVNVSSPNTPGLRDLQSVDALRPLLRTVRETADTVVASRQVPLLVKIAPDLADDDVVAVADLALELGLDGIIATNTTIARDGLRSDPAAVTAAGAGGLSGVPLRQRSLQVLRLLRSRVDDRLTLVSVGGVTDADDVWERLRMGASLVQAYSAFIYGGPLWAAGIHRELRRRVRAAGLSGIDELIGTGT